MKVLYVNPNINHHKLPFYTSLKKYYGAENVLYATPLIYEEMRIKMGFSVYNNIDDIYYINDNNILEFEKIFFEYDVVLCSIRDFYPLMKKRVDNHKITFYFSERWFKPPYGKIRIFSLHMLKLIYYFRKLSRSQYFYYLAQGEYAAKDFISIGIRPRSIFSFGYFTSISKHNSNIKLFPEDKINILWCGRIISWKNVSNLVKAFIEVCALRNNVHLTIIGNGKCEREIVKLIKGKEDIITHMGFLPAYQIRYYMNQADIYVLPSSGTEGWGAVVNEAMAEGCAIIGSSKAGSIKSMINNDVNGVVLYKNDISDIKDSILNLIDDTNKLRRLQSAALQSIQIWSPDNACLRFVTIVDLIMNNKPYNVYFDGPLKIL